MRHNKIVWLFVGVKHRNKNVQTCRQFRRRERALLLCRIICCRAVLTAATFVGCIDSLLLTRSELR